MLELNSNYISTNHKNNNQSLGWALISNYVSSLFRVCGLILMEKNLSKTSLEEKEEEKTNVKLNTPISVQSSNRLSRSNMIVQWLCGSSSSCSGETHTRILLNKVALKQCKRAVRCRECPYSLDTDLKINTLPICIQANMQT